MSERCRECELEEGHLGDCLVPYKERIRTLEAENEAERVLRWKAIDRLDEVLTESEGLKTEVERLRAEAEGLIQERALAENEARDLRFEKRELQKIIGGEPL